MRRLNRKEEEGRKGQHVEAAAVTDVDVLTGRRCWREKADDDEDEGN